MFVKRAAILYEDGEVFEGKDYPTIYNLARQLGAHGEGIRGFIDSSDNFINAETALELAKAAHQLPEDYAGELYPEDIFGGHEYAID